MTEIKARTTLYRGVQMRSRLEADFAAFLDRGGVSWEYEPVCFAGPHGQWLPDFRVLDGAERIYAEIKPESLRNDQIDPTLKRMRVAWLTEPAALLHLAIWPFGKPRQSFNIMGDTREDLTWWCHTGAGDLMPWPGMGQLKRMAAELADDELTDMLRRIAGEAS